MTDKRVKKAIRLVLWINLSAFWIAGPTHGFQTEATASVRSPELTESINRAFQLIGDGKFKEAREELKRSQELAAGPCGECLLGMSHVYASEKDWKRAQEAARQALPLLPAPSTQARAYSQLGTAAFQAKDPKEAEDAFRHAVSSGGAWGTLARYNLAQVLLTRHRWNEAAEMARSYLKDAGQTGRASGPAHIVLCQARLHLPDDPKPPLKPRSETDFIDSESKRVGAGVTRPEILFQTRPVYPEAARREKEQGTAIVEAIIDQEGCVTNVRALKGPHSLLESAKDAVRRWVFRPAMLEGIPVKVFYVLTVNYAIQSGPPTVDLPGIIP